MSLRRAAPGPQLSAGRIRVDAAKAIAKLREYQLADRTAWVLEGIRAAVAAKATKITLGGDANDVWLSWEGEAWPDELLPRLFDELVSPEPASENHHVRLLAAAINSALGMDPAHVDVIAIRQGSASRVRYTPEILVEPASDLVESTLRHVAVEPIEPPEGLPAGMLVHLRRRFVDWRVFRDPPELAVAKGACRDIAVPLHVGDQVLHRDRSHDLIRVPLGEGIDGFIAVTEAESAGASAMLEVAERGVVLSEYVLGLLDGRQRGRIPIRTFIDAPRMPTNASRSQVRLDAFPISEGTQRAHKLVAELIAKLSALAATDARARASALSLLAAFCGGSQWHVDAPSLRGPLRELVQLPLVRNAVGQPRALSKHWRAEVHTGAKPFPEELAPWLDDVLWAPLGDPAAELIERAAIDTRGTRRLARWARRQLRAQKQFYAHTKREVRVLTSEQPHMRAALGVEVPASAVGQEPFANLTGEVCIYPAGATGALAVLLEGRTLDRVEFDSPLCFDVVIDSPNVTPADRYRGVKRDAAYKRVERAMRAGIVRALEAHALATRDPKHAATDAALFRKGFSVLGELGVPLRGPLTRAPAFRAADGRWLALADLAKEKVLGVVVPGETPTLPHARVVIEIAENDRKQLRDLVPARLVPYRRRVTSSAEQTLTTNMIMQGGGALAIRSPGVLAVLTPSTHPQMRLFHLGAELDNRPLLCKYLPCMIAVDCDAFVPDEDWTRLVDDAGISERDLGAWELALVRSIARAIIGERPPELTTGSVIDVDGRLGVALCEAILRHDPRELLGDELVAKLRSAKILMTLGSLERYSIADLAQTFSAAIPFVVDAELVPVDGFEPLLVARKETAVALAKLVGREVAPGLPMLQRYHRKATRDKNLAAHTQREQRPLAVRAKITAPVRGPVCHGVVGVHDSVFEIGVYVDSRPFTVIFPPNMEVPLIAAVEVASEHCDETFEGLTAETRAALATEVRAAVPTLLAEIARLAPEQLGDEGPARMLLSRTRISDGELKRIVQTTPAFHTIQGGRISIEQAAQPRRIVSVAAWHGEWLGPGDGEPLHALDGPVLYVPDSEHELSKVIDMLHPGAVVDVSEEVGRLQSRRRIAQGLVPTPRVANASAELKRPLIAFGTLGTKLGVGEIALVEDSKSSVALYEDGIQKRIESLDVVPSVAIAVQLAEAQALLEPVQQLAIELVKQVLATVDADKLPPRIQRNLMRAALARRLDPDLLKPLAKWRDFIAQLAHFGDAWVVTEPTELLPLDEERKVFYFERETFDLARRHNWRVIDAKTELVLDDAARKNRARKPATYLQLPTRDGVLATLTLSGDGVSSPRGVIAILSPTTAAWRGVWPHSKMHPFDRVEDPCRWPTLAVIDDARLVPDRTWSQPQHNDAWSAVAKELRDASERALATIGEVPDDALASLRINNHACADVAALRKSPRSLIRGVLWLTGEPRRSVGIQVAEGMRGVRSFVPGDALSIGGRLLLFAPDGLDAELALAQLCGHSHGKLVRQLMKAEHPDPDLVAAHVAHALFLRTLRATDVRGLEFGCFAQRPLDARALTSLFRREDIIMVIKPGDAPDPNPDTIEIVEDGSLLSATIINDLGSRTRRLRRTEKPRIVSEAPIEVAKPPPAPKPKPKSEPPHPLRLLVTLLRARLSQLGIGGYRWSIIERHEPMFAFSDEVEVAGNNVRLRALAAAAEADGPIAKAGIDVVVAHLVTVLNVSLSQITDASEAHALGVLLTNPPSADQPRSRQS